MDIERQKHSPIKAPNEIQEHEQQSLSEIAKLLTRGPVESIEHVEQIKQLEDKDSLRTNAEHMSNIAEEECATLRQRIGATLESQSDEDKERTKKLLDAIDTGDESKMHELGLSFEYTWLNDVIATMIKGKPPVEIETVSPYASMHTDPETGKLEVDISKIPPDEMSGILVASIMRKLDTVAHNTRVVSLLDEFTPPKGTERLSKEDQDAYVVAMSEFYAQAGIIQSTDRPGEDFVMLRESELAGRVDDLEAKLAKQDNGQLEKNEKGELYFMPNEELVDSLAIHNPKSIKELKKRGILLRRADGSPTCQAMDASGYLNEINKEYMHVIMLDKRMENQQDKTYALLKSMGVVKQERYHNILFDSEKLSPEVVAYGVAKQIQIHANKFVNALDKYNEWEQFDPYEYVSRNYGEKILEEDDQIIKSVVQALESLSIEENSLKRVADIGSGPNLYPSMLMSPYLEPGAEVDMIEFSPANREYMTKLKAGTLEDEHQAAWQKFENLMVQMGGSKYQGSETKARQSASIKAGNIFELPESEYDLVSSYFVAESIVDSQLPFRDAISSMAKSIKPDGAMIVAHMVGSEGYYAGEGTHFPAVNLSIEDLKEAYADAGLEFKIVPIGENAEEKAREGYHGMAVVVAKRKQ